MKLFLKQKYINIISLFGLIVFITLSITSYYQMKKLSNANAWVIHTYRVIDLAGDTMMSLNDLESSLRGYLLTKDSTYITSFEDTLTLIQKDTEQLQLLVQDTKNQQERIKSFILLLNTRIALLKDTARVSQQRSLKEATSLLFANKLISNRIKKVSLSIIAEEKNLLQIKSNDALTHFNKITMLILVGNILSISLIVFGLFLLNQQLLFRNRIERKLRASEKDLLHLAYHDSLTDLANRPLLFKTVDNFINDKKHHEQTVVLAMLMIDIDNFKSINDSLGYELGDQLILQFSQRLKKLYGHFFLAHLGGDEFVIILEDVEHMDEIQLVAQTLLDSTREPFIIKNHTLYITISVGISIYPNNGIDSKTLMKNADIAVYRAKEMGRNNYQFCTPEMTIEVKKRALLDTHLHQALSNNEFIFLYQPKVSLNDDKIISVEALIRWNRPKVGLINPANFIAVAESNGLIVPLGEWMLHDVCTQGKKWHDNGLLINIAINISTRQLVISDFVSSVRNILAKTGFDPHYLELEITESILLEHSSNNLSALKALKEMGIKITIDDFGTGYSSLSYLKAFEIDKLKIDKAFIDEITASNQINSIINAIIVMAHSLGLRVIAEGVEEAYQVDFLKKHHCDEVQGFFYSPPLSVDEVESYIRKFSGN